MAIEKKRAYQSLRELMSELLKDPFYGTPCKKSKASMKCVTNMEVCDKYGVV